MSERLRSLGIRQTPVLVLPPRATAQNRPPSNEFRTARYQQQFRMAEGDEFGKPPNHFFDRDNFCKHQSAAHRITLVGHRHHSLEGRRYHKLRQISSKGHRHHKLRQID